MQPTIKLEGSSDSRPYRRKDCREPATGNDARAEQVNSEASARQRTRGHGPTPRKKAKDATVERLSGDVELPANPMLGTAGLLRLLRNATENQAKISLRVYCLAGDTKIDLLKAGDDPPPQKAK